MGFKIKFSTDKIVKITDIEIKELISKFLDDDILLMDDDLKDGIYPIITKYKDRG